MEGTINRHDGPGSLLISKPVSSAPDSYLRSATPTDCRRSRPAETEAPAVERGGLNSLCLGRFKALPPIAAPATNAVAEHGQELVGLALGRTLILTSTPSR
jgi:hypothetical protein